MSNKYYKLLLIQTKIHQNQETTDGLEKFWKSGCRVYLLDEVTWMGLIRKISGRWGRRWAGCAAAAPPSGHFECVFCLLRCAQLHDVLRKILESQRPSIFNFASHYIEDFSELHVRDCTRTPGTKFCKKGNKNEKSRYWLPPLMYKDTRNKILKITLCSDLM